MARFQEEKVTHADMNKEVGSKYGQDKNSSRSEGGNLPIPPRNRDTWRFIRSIYVCSRALWRAGISVWVRRILKSLTTPEIIL